MSSHWLNCVHFCYWTGDLDQRLPAETDDGINKVIGRFNIGAYAKAKKIAKEKANATALAKSKELTNILNKCQDLEEKISQAKLKVYLCSRQLTILFGIHFLCSYEWLKHINYISLDVICAWVTQEVHMISNIMLYKKLTNGQWAYLVFALHNLWWFYLWRV